jgi:hypothetical protein
MVGQFAEQVCRFVSRQQRYRHARLGRRQGHRSGPLGRVGRRPAPLPGRSPVPRFRFADPADSPDRHPEWCVVKAALLAFAFSITAPVHVTVAALGTRVCVPVPWLVLAAEVLTAAGLAWLAVRAASRFRSSPYRRPVRSR